MPRTFAIRDPQYFNAYYIKAMPFTVNERRICGPNFGSYSSFEEKNGFNPLDKPEFQQGENLERILHLLNQAYSAGYEQAREEMRQAIGLV